MEILSTRLSWSAVNSRQSAVGSRQKMGNVKLSRKNCTSTKFTLSVVEGLTKN